MVDITDDIINTLKSYSFTIPVKDVREPYSSKKPVYPMIVVSELKNGTRLQVGGEEIHSDIDFRFEIYSRDTSHNDRIYTKRKVADIIAFEVDDIMRTHYGMKRVGDPVIMPYDSDGTIIRRILTYTGIIDNRTMIIYQ